MEWLQNGVTLQRETGALELLLNIIAPRAEHAGKYSCMVNFVDGQRQVSSAGFLNIYSKSQSWSCGACCILHFYGSWIYRLHSSIILVVFVSTY